VTRDPLTHCHLWWDDPDDFENFLMPTIAAQNILTRAVNASEVRGYTAIRKSYQS